MMLKLELSMSSPVATSLEVSMPHQPATFSFPKRQFSKSKSIVFWFQAGRAVLFMELHRYIINEVADSNSTFCFVSMCNGEDALRKC